MRDRRPYPAPAPPASPRRSCGKQRPRTGHKYPWLSLGPIPRGQSTPPPAQSTFETAMSTLTKCLQSFCLLDRYYWTTASKDGKEERADGRNLQARVAGFVSGHG